MVTRTKSVSLGLVVADFYAELAERMVASARKAAQDGGAKIMAVVKVPGSFDIPLAVKRLLERKDVDGVVALGAVIKGETDHDQVIAYATAKTLQELSLHFNKPVTLGVNGPGMTLEQAQERVDRAASALGTCIRLCGGSDE